MAPKKATAAGTKSSKPKSTSAPAHGSYQEMIKEAIISLKERNGSSRQAIKKYIQANNNLGSTTEAAFNTHLSRALSSGEDAGVFARPKGPSGPVKLAKKDAAKPKKEAASAPAKAAAPKKEKTTTKKTTTKAAPKTAAAKKTGTKATTKKTTTKANAGKPRKTAAAAPAVEDKPPVVLGKTKSGRVTKTKAPAASTIKKPAAKKAATKKTTTKKATTSKKAATPKKAEAAA